MLRIVSGKEIDALCQKVLRGANEPMTTSELVCVLGEQFDAEIDATSPARLISTRMSMLTAVESTDSGWQLVTRSMQLESDSNG